MIDVAPEVSVIMPVYNRDWCVARAVESVMAITSHRLELIVVDDGSTDRTAEIVANLARCYAERIRILRHAHACNRGISASRNLGLRHARAPLIAFLDSDDCYLVHRFECAVTWMRAHPQLLAGIEPYEVEENGIRQLEQHLTVLDIDADGRVDALDALLNGRRQWTTPVFTVRREAFAKLGEFDSRFHVGEDTALWLRFAAVRGVGVIGSDRPVATVHRHDNHSWTPLDEDRSWQVYLRALVDAVAWSRKRSSRVDVAARRALRTRLRSYLIETLIRPGAHRGRALRAWWQAVRQAPALTLDRAVNANLVRVLTGQMRP